MDRLRPRRRHQAVCSPHLGFAGGAIRQTAGRTHRHLHINRLGADRHPAQRQQRVAASRTLRRQQWPHRADYFDIYGAGVFDVFGGGGVVAALTQFNYFAE